VRGVFSAPTSRRRESREAMPPLWQYLCPSPKSHSRRWRPPKGMDPGTVGYLSCKPAVSGAAAVGATMVIMDPGSLAWS
jgi:hypothetical protein